MNKDLLGLEDSNQDAHLSAPFPNQSPKRPLKKLVKSASLKTKIIA
jgi:hypothetical protein